MIFAFVSIVGRREVTGNEGREKGCHATKARSHSRCGCCDYISVFKTPKPSWHSSVGGLLRHCLWFWAIQINLTRTDMAAAIAVSSLFDISAVPLCFTVVGQFSYQTIYETNSFCAEQRNEQRRLTSNPNRMDHCCFGGGNVRTTCVQNVSV